LISVFGICSFVFAVGFAQAQETQLGADFRQEGEKVKADCTSFRLASIVGCGEDLFTDHPLHIVVGSLAPQNGFGAGPAFVSHWTPNESWRLNFDLDAVATPNGSWRAGAYMTAVLVRHPKIVVSPGGGGATQPSNLALQEAPVFHLFAQSISLNKLSYFGEGPNTSDTARAYFGMRETVVGTNAVWPVFSKLNLSLYGEANGRFVEMRPSPNEGGPSIEQIYTPLTAPGLGAQPAYAQFGEGVRLRPEFAGGYARLNYLVLYRQYVGPSDSSPSFQRLTLDLAHQFPIYKRTRTLQPRDFNGPDECAASSGSNTCPAVTRDLEGSFGVRFLMNESFVASGRAVPFYFQPTLGGSDVNGDPALSSYQDYRFRGPNTILVRGSFEHSIWGPLGFTAMVDAGKVALTHGDLDFTHLLHSYSVGLTLRAGGFPMVAMLFSWGGREGTHFSTTMNNSLLGGAARPSLY
jgi:hypothetical protein